jgi:ATP-dependent Clp protease ATP-binding subunit ClpA
MDCEAVRREILNRLENRTVEPAPTRSFLDVARETPRSARFHRVHELAYAEAWQSRRRFLSTADQLLGVLRLREGVAGRALARLGVDAAALRTAAGPFQAEEDEESPAFYAAETEERAVAICDTLWDRVAAYTS